MLNSSHKICGPAKHAGDITESAVEGDFVIFDPLGNLIGTERTREAANARVQGLVDELQKGARRTGQATVPESVPESVPAAMKTTDEVLAQVRAGRKEVTPISKKVRP